MKNKIKKLINNIFKVFLALIPNKKFRAKLKADWTKLYLKKYVSIAVQNYKELENKPYDNNPPIIQYWEQGIENAPNVVKTCINSIDKFEPDRKHIVLDFKTIEDYVEIPPFIYDLKKQGKISYAQFSDILRSCLLATTPCIWVDSTILFTGSLPNYVKENDFFMYKGIKKSPENFAGANYFISSKTPNALLIQLKESILNYWKDNDFLISYFTHPHYITLLTKYNENLWNKVPTIDEALTLQFSKILFEKFDEKRCEEIKKLCPVHKLSYKIPKKLNCKIEETFYFKLLGENNAWNFDCNPCL